MQPPLFKNKMLMNNLHQIAHIHIYSGLRSLAYPVDPLQGSRLILPTGLTCATNFLSWSHQHIIWLQF